MANSKVRFPQSGKRSYADTVTAASRDITVNIQGSEGIRETGMSSNKAGPAHIGFGLNLATTTTSVQSNSNYGKQILDNGGENNRSLAYIGRRADLSSI